ncbi:hypothetical protein HHK36_009686 [Tetracentron sinense]|uniref:Uncharacterized protein n=1 Tax=Tetracentron sinense TaxID=13715 RepID=A0A834ZLV7_TETSI|nr:hypothetical protein HHK36_009686 [Tetracentron sinense]
MAISSNRSRSPISSRANPNSRTPESSNSVRRSFSGNPFTRPSIFPNPRRYNPIAPANSPADLSRRNSAGREGISSFRVSYEQKENDKDQNLKPGRVRSPAVSKGTKNFMTPTISAASKIAASPRMKVLTERNEAVRTSASFSDWKPLFTAMNLSDVAEDIGLKSEIISDSQVSSEIHKKSESLSEPAIADFDHKEANFEATPKGDGSSILVSDGKPPFGSMNRRDFAAVEVIGSKPDEVLLNSQVFSNTQKFSETISEARSLDFEYSNVEFGSKISPSCSSPSPFLAPLDIDPSFPPYDPKTNYLSPRPKFLHYKPNPRIEAYPNKERGFDSGEATLEDSFTSESCSDSESSEETQSGDSQNEFGDAYSSENIEEEETQVSEPDTSNTHKPNKIVQVKRMSRPCSLVRSKSISLLLVLVIACLSISVTDSPVLYPSTFKDQTFSKLDAPSNLVGFAKENFNGLVLNFRHWSVNAISYLPRMIPIAIEVEILGPLHITNLTTWGEEHLVDGYRTEEKREQNNLESINEGEFEEEPNEEEGQAEIQTGENIEEDEAEVRGINNEELEKNSPLTRQEQDMEPKKLEEVEYQVNKDFTPCIGIEPGNNILFDEQSALVSKALEISELAETEEFQYANDFTSRTGIELQRKIEFDEQSAQISQGLEINLKMAEIDELQYENDLDSHANVVTSAEVAPKSSEVDTSYGSSQNSPLHGSEDEFWGRNVLGINSPLHGSEYEFWARNVLGIFPVILTLMAATAFVYLKQEKISAPEAAITVEQLLAKKLISSSTSASREDPYQERTSSRNWAAEVEMVGESCPSEMSSSYQKSSSISRKSRERVKEVQSHERKHRRNSNRESMASFSEFSAASPSYGSFTTFEKIHSKHGCGDEEDVTPVRRSSRIRKQITSP